MFHFSPALSLGRVVGATFSSSCREPQPGACAAGSVTGQMRGLRQGRATGLRPRDSQVRERQESGALSQGLLGFRAVAGRRSGVPML